MPELMLTPAQRQTLKGRAHGLKPVVLLGAAGLTEMVLREIDRALTAHELVKIKIPDDDRERRGLVYAEAAEKLSAAQVQSIGKVIVLFRPKPESEEKQDAPGLLQKPRDAPRDGRRNDGRIGAKRR